MTSAAEQQLVGWPLPAAEVDRMESIRSRAAIFFNAGIRTARSAGIGLPILFQIALEVQPFGGSLPPRRRFQAIQASAILQL
jgi:hypothetical protein